MLKLPPVQSAYYPMAGGLDLLTPAIAMNPGKLFDSQNYEPEISGGYRRIDGYERYDGRPSPSSASYWIVDIEQTGTITNGATITGATSGATGRVLGVFDSVLVLGRVVGDFDIGENLQISAVTVAVANSQSLQDGSPIAADDAEYTYLASNDYRADILAVPGSGQIRGVWVYNDITYAFRDNVGGTAGNMWKSSAGGWVQIAFGNEIQFSGAVAQIFDGNTITGGTSGATAVVTRAMLRSGSWTSAGVGTLIINAIIGTFQNGEELRVGGVKKAVSASLATAITRLPGGRLEFVNANFTAGANGLKVYGADGVNLGFEFDGTNYIPIRTGMAVDTPSHVMFHKTHLFYSFKGSVQFSGIGDPYAWTAVLGAGEIATGNDVTGFLPQGGESGGSSMAIFTKTQTFILYGNSAADFSLVASIYDLGYTAGTMQPVSNNTYGLTARGVQCLITTLTYGDFDYAAVTFLIQPLMTAKRGKETASTTSRTKDQYRLFWNDGTALAIGLTGDKVNGSLLLNYNMPVRCVVTATLSTGEEVCFFGSDDGYVYQDNIGTSQDGNAIEAWIRPAFNNLKSPQVIKRYRRATFEVKAMGYARVNVSYDLGYANPDAQQSATRPDLSITGAGGYWDQFIWDQFTWDSQVVNTPTISVEGSGKNIAFLFYSNRYQDQSHTVQGVTINYSIRRLGRSDT